jgi:hypothetical protein
MRKSTKRSLNAVDKEIETAFYRHCSGWQIPMLDIHKIFRAGREAAQAGQDIAAAVVRAAEAVRVG